MAWSAPKRPSKASSIIPGPFNTSTLALAWLNGSVWTRLFIGLAGLFAVAGAALFTVGRAIWQSSTIVSPLSQLFLMLAGLIAATVVQVHRIVQREARLKIIQKLEDRVQSHPGQADAAWDLARVKLESYLDRNLAQVNSIFWLVIVVMTAGFSLMGTGVWISMHNTGEVAPAVIASLSGVVIQFIAATFLVIYRSTMEQARSYVTVLERINAVGMALQILKGIEGDEVAVRNKARAELAKDLVRMYATPGRPQIARPPRSRRTQSTT